MDMRQSRLAEKAKPRKARCRCILCWPNSCFRWKRKTPYSQPGLGVSSFKLKGEQARVANMLVEDYLRPAAVKVAFFHRTRTTKADR